MIVTSKFPVSTFYIYGTLFFFSPKKICLVEPEQSTYRICFILLKEILFLTTCLASFVVVPHALLIHNVKSAPLLATMSVDLLFKSVFKLIY